MRKRTLWLWLAVAGCLGGGVINIVSVITPSLPERRALLRAVFPLEFLHISRFLTLLIGFALIISSINIYKRKKRAFAFVLALSILSAVFHLVKGLDFEEAALSLLLFVVLLITRKSFTVKSSIPDLRLGLIRLILALFLALGYGVLGFWLLDERHFGIAFTLSAALRKTVQYFTFSQATGLFPHTRYARWFLRSLDLISVTAIVYSLYALFRPAYYRLRTLIHERALAEEILSLHGRSALDYFKLWPDKSYYFVPSRSSFLAYAVANNFSIVLGDPVGPEEELKPLIASFKEFCAENDWRVCFHQTLPDLLPLYRELGFKKLKIGDEAIVELGEFSLEGKRNKHLRHYANQFDKLGFGTAHYSPPIPHEILRQIRDVSDEWLKIPGRRERGFTQGVFSPGYVEKTPLFTVIDKDHRVLAFANIIPSYYPGETTVDMMRHRVDAPAGVMDYLFVNLFKFQKEKGFTRFNLGMAPMSGFQESEEAGQEERAVHFFLQRLNFIFSYGGLFLYKKKFATRWEPRYVVYRTVFDLPWLAIALNNVSSVKSREFKNG